MFKIIVIASTILMATAAAAQGFAPWNALSKADTDRDSQITPKELIHFHDAGDFPGFQPHMVTHFAEYDADGNGVVTSDEVTQLLAKREKTPDDLNKWFGMENECFSPWSN